MREEMLHNPDGLRIWPDDHRGVGVLTLGGSSGRIDTDRARTYANAGMLAETFRWFGGKGQQPGPWEVPIETFQERVAVLAADCDRVLLSGVSFGAEAMLVTAAHTPDVAGVIAFAPSDVVWAGVRPDGSQTSHWTLGGEPVPFVPFLDDWEPADDPPSFTPLYRDSYRSATPATLAAAAIPVERIPQVLLVAGGDDRVWPAVDHAKRIASRRAEYGVATTQVMHAGAGHRTLLPDEPVIRAGQDMARGGYEESDRRLGDRAWTAIAGLCGV